MLRMPESPLLCVLVLAAAGACLAADWPQYRADAARGGYTAEALPAKPTLHWMRPARHAPRRAWVGRSLARSRMKFDWAYSVVVADGLCVFGSSADDKVTALDAATGRERWSVFTGGPVRLAPAIWRGRVYAVSDDGCLYCLSLKDGKQLWKLRAGPSGERVVGNGRLVSRWVARGGPAIRDGIVYFGAGIWPIEGVFIYAVDAASGKVLWCNDNAGFLEIDQPHMVCFSRGGVASQGYLAVTKDHVLVTTGRSVPAAFDRETGRFIHFHLSRYGGKTPWGTGGGDVVATDEVYFNSGMAFDPATGLRYHPIGRRFWWDPFKRDGRRCHGEFHLGDRQVICVTPDGFVRSEGPKLCAATLARRTYNARREADTARATPRLPTVKQVTDKHHLERIDDAPLLKDRWSLALDGQPTALLVAGTRIVVGAAGKLAAVDGATRKVAWSAKVDGTVHSLAFADGRLLASTDKGTIYCFARPRADARPAVLEPRAKASPYPSDSVAATAAAEILLKTGIRKGWCLDLDCGDGALACELARRSELSVVALTSDPTEAEAARRKLDAAGLYGVRVAVVVGTVKDVPDYFANLVVSATAPEQAEIARIQRPCGGTVCVGRPGAMRVSVRGPLEGAGSWTHNLADAGNTMCSGDAIVRAPLGMLWYQDETLETVDRHGKNVAPLVASGVLLREGIHALKALDAYNGTLLWELKLPGILAAYQEGTQIGAAQIGSTYCIAADVVYVRRDDRCLLLDLYTGKQLAVFTAPKLPGGKRGRWGYIACDGGVLVGGLMNEAYVIKCNHGKGGPGSQKPMDDHLTETSLLFAMDARTGKLKWTFAPKHSIRNNAIAIGKGRVHLIDREPAEIDKLLRTEVEARRRGKKPLPVHPTGILLALDAQTGQVRWRDGEQIFGTTLAASTRHDVLLMGYGRVGFPRPSDTLRGMRAYKASTGERLWENQQGSTRPALVGRTIYGFPMAWDLLTGRQRMVEDPRPGQWKGHPWSIRGKGQGCGLVAGSEHLLLLRSATVGYYDLDRDGGWLENYGGLRAGCFINAIPACGIVLVPDDTRACRCSYQNQATVALKQHGLRPPDVEPQAGQANVRFGRHAKEPVFTGRLVVTITHDRKDLQLRYTLDDSYPTAESPLYGGPLTLTETTAIRAAAFRDGRKVAERDAIVFTKVHAFEQPPKGRPKAKAGRRQGK